MLTAKKLVAGTGVSLATVAFAVLPLGTASAATPLPKPHDQASNSAIDVQTSLNCNTHVLTAKVTNKATSDITPNITFNKQPPVVNMPTPIKPGQTASYFYDYSGNNRLVNVEVDVDTYKPVKLDPMLTCNEPVSFQVTDASSSAVGGILTNNSTFVAQVALTQVGDGDIHVENLQPGEARFVALPFNGMPGQTMAEVNIGTATGFEGSYFVDLTQPPVTPIHPLPGPSPKV